MVPVLSQLVLTDGLPAPVACAGFAEGEGGSSIFGGFNPPQPGSTGFGFGSGGGSKAKDVEEGGGGEEGGEEIGQELFGGQEVAPVVQLSEVPKQTGEEGENSVFTGEHVCWAWFAAVCMPVGLCHAPGFRNWQRIGLQVVRPCAARQQRDDAVVSAAANSHSGLFAQSTDVCMQPCAQRVWLTQSA